MFIVKRQAGATTYYTHRDTKPWSAELRNAKVYDTWHEAQAAIGDMDWPTGSIEIEELPPLRYA